MIPRSRKGKGEKKVTHYSAPISATLADALRVGATGRKPNDPLLLKPSGEAWKKSDHSRLFARVAERAGVNPRLPKPKKGEPKPAKPDGWATIYALRHSSIVRQLLAGVPDPYSRGEARFFRSDDRTHLQRAYRRSRRRHGAQGDARYRSAGRIGTFRSEPRRTAAVAFSAS